jgi:tetratricopeptide (TPR) repeat protein
MENAGKYPIEAGIAEERLRAIIRKRSAEFCGIGRLELAAGNVPQAIGAFKVALHLSPQNTEAEELLKSAEAASLSLKRANALLEQAQHELAAGNVSRAMKISDDFFQAALDLWTGFSIAYPAAEKIHELMVAASKAVRNAG